MSSTIESTTHAASCSVSSGAVCTCGGGCETQPVDSNLPELLSAAAGVGCSITPKDAPAQLERIVRLRPHFLGIERRRGSLAISFDADADGDVVDQLVETEQGCCSFLNINRVNTSDTIRVVFSSDDPRHEPALALIARTFDPAELPTAKTTGSVSSRRNKTVLGALGVACLACFLPGLLAAGAVGSAATALGGEARIAAILALVLGIGALAMFARRRSRNGSVGCGC